MAKKKPLIGDKLKKQISDNLRYYEKQGRDTSEFRSKFAELRESYKGAVGQAKSGITRALQKLKSDISSRLSEFSKKLAPEEKVKLREQTRIKREQEAERNKPNIPDEWMPDYESPSEEQYWDVDEEEFTQAELEYNGFLDRIKGAPKEEIIHNMLESEIRQFGLEKVIRGFHNMSAADIQDLEWAAFVPSNSSDNYNASRIIAKFAKVIKGVILSFDDLKQMSEEAESEEDFGPVYK